LLLAEDLAVLTAVVAVVAEASSKLASIYQLPHTQFLLVLEVLHVQVHLMMAQVMVDRTLQHLV
jgi:hypothetical protein